MEAVGPLFLCGAGHIPSFSEPEASSEGLLDTCRVWELRGFSDEGWIGEVGGLLPTWTWPGASLLLFPGLTPAAPMPLGVC